MIIKSDFEVAEAVLYFYLIDDLCGIFCEYFY